MGNRVEKIQTPISESEMAAAIVNGWQQLFGSPPAKEQVALIMAQNALETGNRKSMWNYNVGNITTTESGPYNYFEAVDRFTTGEMAGKNFKFRAYDNIQEGVLDYLKFLSQSPRYAQAWQHILNPDPVSYSKALKSAGYYTSEEAGYTKSLKSIFDNLNKSKALNQLSATELQNLKQELRTLKLQDAPTSNITSVLDKYLKNVTPTVDSKLDVANDYSGQLSSVLDKYLKNTTPASMSSQTPIANDSTDALNSVLDKYLKSAASLNKRNYAKYLQNNTINIKIVSSSVVDNIEFANILCSALDEELSSSSFVHTDGKSVEIECNIPGPHNICIEAVDQVSKIVAENFSVATKKIGSIKIKTNIIPNKKSIYEPISLKTAELNHRKFLLKFI